MNVDFSEMTRAVIGGNKEDARALAQGAISEGFSAEKLLDEGFLPGIQELGKRFDEGELFLPELVRGAEAMKAALEVLTPRFSGDRSRDGARSGRILLGTVEGDIHDIGKSIVASVLTANGFEVFDLGADVPNSTFADKVAELKPDIVGMSSLITTTMYNAAAVMELLEERGLRDSVRVIVGGAPVSRKWCDEIGADGFAPSASAAVDEIRKLLQ